MKEYIRTQRLRSIPLDLNQLELLLQNMETLENSLNIIMTLILSVKSSPQRSWKTLRQDACLRSWEHDWSGLRTAPLHGKYQKIERDGSLLSIPIKSV